MSCPDIRSLMPAGVDIKPIFDQSIFVKASLNSVLMGGAMAAGLTALMILLFLGNWRLTLIILASIPLSIITAVLVMYCMGQTLNTMTLGGFALAVGILVDNSTVVIENIERHLDALQKESDRRNPRRGGGDRSPDAAFHAGDLHRVRADFSAAGNGQISLLAAGAVGLRFAAGEPGAVVHAGAGAVQIPDAVAYGRRIRITIQRISIGQTMNPLRLIHRGFDSGFNRFRELITHTVTWCVSRPLPTVVFFLLLMVVSCLLFPLLGRGFLPAGGCGADAAARALPAGNAHRNHAGGFCQGGSGDPADRRQ